MCACTHVSYAMRLPARLSHAQCDCLHACLMRNTTACTPVSCAIRLPARLSHAQFDCLRGCHIRNSTACAAVACAMRLPARLSHAQCDCLAGCRMRSATAQICHMHIATPCIVSHQSRRQLLWDVACRDRRCYSLNANTLTCAINVRHQTLKHIKRISEQACIKYITSACSSITNYIYIMHMCIIY